MHAGAVHFDSLAVEVDYELSHLDNRLSVTLGAAHDGVDARHKFVLVEWLGHVVIGAEAETIDLIFDAGEAGKDQSWRLRLRDSQVAQHLEARHIRQVQVEQDDGEIDIVYRGRSLLDQDRWCRR